MRLALIAPSTMLVVARGGANETLVVKGLNDSVEASMHRQHVFEPRHPQPGGGH